MIDHIIDLYTSSGQYLGFFNVGQGSVFPNRHDIIKVEENVFDVVRRQIDYTVSPAKMTLFVVDVDELIITLKRETKRMKSTDVIKF